MSIIADQPDSPIDKLLFRTRLGRFVYRYICWITLGRTSIKEFTKDAEHWVKCNERLRDAMTQITTAQGLVLAVCGAFLTTTPPLQAMDYTMTRSYLWFFVAFAISVWGLICQLLFFRINLMLTVDELTNDTLSHYACISYFLVYDVAYAAFFYSMVCLESGFLAAILGGPYDILCFFCNFVVVFFMILFAIFIMKDTPGANITLVTGTAGLECLLHLIGGFICAFRIYI